MLELGKADRTEGFCPGGVTREPGDKQQSTAAGRLAEGWQAHGACEEAAFEVQPGPVPGPHPSSLSLHCLAWR